MARGQGALTAQALFLAACSICPELMEESAEHTKDSLREQDLWTELVACILGSRVRYETATSALERLLRTGLLDIGYLARSRGNAMKEIASALGDLADADGDAASYPFPILRAQQICDSYQALYRDGGSLNILLSRHTTGGQLRRQLAVRAAGIGPKQASLFLRNVGYSDDLAVLDVHVLRYMLLMALRETEEVPRNLRAYESVEQVLRTHAQEAGYPLGCFDLAVWIVMRAVAPPSRRSLCAS